MITELFPGWETLGEMILTCFWWGFAGVTAALVLILIYLIAMVPVALVLEFMKEVVDSFKQ